MASRVPSVLSQAGMELGWQAVLLQGQGSPQGVWAPPHRRHTGKAAGGPLKQLPRPWGLELPSLERASGPWAGHTGSRQHEGEAARTLLPGGVTPKTRAAT